MLKLKIFDKEIKNNPEYLFLSFEELYCDLLNSRYLSNDCEYETDYILQKFKLNFSDWDSFLNDLIENDKESDYFSDFDKFLISKNINYSINNLSEQDFYNIISDNLSINGTYKYYYSYIENESIEIDTFLIKFFDESGNNIIENLVFCENQLNEELTTLELRQKFLLLFNTTILDSPGVYIDDLFDKYCVIFEDKIYNSENDIYMYINSQDFNIYDFDYYKDDYKKFLVNYEINGKCKDFVFYAKNKITMREWLFYKVSKKYKKNYKILNVSEIN